jgi:hypothetical protein
MIRLFFVTFVTQQQDAPPNFHTTPPAQKSSGLFGSFTVLTRTQWV